MPMAMGSSASVPTRTVSSRLAPTFSRSRRATASLAPFLARLATASSPALRVNRFRLAAARVGHDPAQPDVLVDLAEAGAGHARRRPAARWRGPAPPPR